MKEQIEIFADEGLSTIFDGDLVLQIDKDTNRLNHKKVVGFRLENAENENARVHCRTAEDLRGVYSATVFFDGVRRKGQNKRSNFFPKDWTREQVTSAIFEAYQNKTPKNLADNQYLGQAADGMTILFWLDESDKITDAMPLRDGVNLRKRRNHSKRHCEQCGQPKHYVCQEHHNFQKKGLKKIYAKIRRRVRKFYFGLSEKFKFAN